MSVWEKFIKRYVWHQDRTPYFVHVTEMNKRQANYEIFAYTVFLGSLFAAISLMSLSGAAAQGRSLGVAFYGFTVLSAALVFGVTKHLWAALYCSAVPVAVLFYFFTKGFPAGLGTIDHVLLIGFALLWARYSMRIVAIARAYDDMDDPGPESGSRRQRRLQLPKD